MQKRLLIIALTLTLCCAANATKTIRFVPIAGTEHDIPVASLEKVVFTQDSVVLISHNGETNPLYKFNYSQMLFTEMQPTDVTPEIKTHEPIKGVKFIQNGQLFIRVGNEIYSIFGFRISSL